MSFQFEIPTTPSETELEEAKAIARQDGILTTPEKLIDDLLSSGEPGLMAEGKKRLLAPVEKRNTELQRRVEELEAEVAALKAKLGKKEGKGKVATLIFGADAASSEEHADTSDLLEAVPIRELDKDNK